MKLNSLVVLRCPPKVKNEKIIKIIIIKNMYVLNFAKASPSSSAVIRLLRRRGVFLTKESFFYNARERF